MMLSFFDHATCQLGRILSILMAILCTYSFFFGRSVEGVTDGVSASASCREKPSAGYGSGVRYDCPATLLCLKGVWDGVWDRLLIILLTSLGRVYNRVAGGSPTSPQTTWHKSAQRMKDTNSDPCVVKAVA